MKDTYSMKFRAAEGVIFRYKDGEGKTVLESMMADGSIAVSAWYTANEAPLVLSGRVQAGDAMMLVVRPYRLELYGNGALLDEEWPYGEPLFAGMVPEEDAVLLCDAPAEEETPSFAGSFTGAEGWYPGGGVFVGDCMPYADGERYHVLYLKDRHRHRSKWQKGAHQWAHISTTDLIHWDIHPMAVEIDDPMEGSICTGSWIRNGGLHRLYYTVRMSDGSSAPIRRSLSEDGWHYRKDRSFGFCLSEEYTGFSARDPKVTAAEDGTLHMFVTTTHRASGKGCLVHLTSADGDTWTERGMIYTSPDGNEPECPDYFALNGWYYLVFSHHGRGQYLISDQPFTGWRTPENPVIPCSSVPKAAVWKGRILFAGFNGNGQYAGHMTFLEAVQDEKGELRYIPVREMENQ